jgi:hypothetical protein
MADEQQPVSFDNTPPTSTQDTSQILPKPVETGALFPVASHDHDGVNSVRFPAGNLLGEPLYKLADVTATAAVTSFDSGTFAAKNVLKIYLYIATRSASTGVNLQFNGDTASNYIWRLSYSAAAYSSATTSSKLALIDTASGASSGTFSLIEIFNIKDHQKMVWGRSYEYLYPDAIPMNVIDDAAFWINEADNITSVKVLSDSTQTFGQNSRLLIYGI